MNSFESFLEDVAKKVSELLGSEAVPDTVRRNNGVLTKGIRVKSTGTGACPRVDLESFYSDFKNGEDLDAIAKQVYKLLAEASLGIGFPDLQSWEAMKDSVIVTLINQERNVDLLSEVPFQDFWGMALICKIYLNHNQNSDDQMMTVTVNNVLLKKWGISKDELFSQAIENSKVLLPVTIQSLEEVMAEVMQKEKDSFKELSKTPMYVMSNPLRINGAATVVYGQEKLTELAGQLGRDLMVLPSSVHEMIIIPDLGASIEELTAMVKSVNKTALSEQDILGDTAYSFRR